MAQKEENIGSGSDASWYEVPYRSLGRAGAWLVTLLLTALVLAMSLLHHFIMDQPRQWDFGAVPDVPGQSIYSSFSASEERPTFTHQLAPLPEAVPLNGNDRGTKGGNHE